MKPSVSPASCGPSTTRAPNKSAFIEAARQMAPLRNLETISEGDHFVQFYEDDKFLVQAVAAYVAQGFVQDHSAVLILTAAHRAAVEAKLTAGGANPEEYQRRGLYYAYDAAETLSHFMVDGAPNARRFRATIEPIVEVANQHGSAVRAFGEMVALLWADGKKGAAIELEMLWNDLMEKNSFALLCAYPIAGFSQDEQTRELRHVCRAHNCVIPHESYCDPFVSTGK
jgi:hypothetical protein